MISEELQDQAALYALGTLDASEATAFETAMNADAELRALVRELRDAVNALAHASPAHFPPAELKQRVLGQIAVEAKPVKITPLRAGQAKSVTARWLPWAIAALLMLGCVLLLARQDRLRKELAEARVNTLYFKLRLLRSHLLQMARAMQKQPLPGTRLAKPG